MAEVTYNEQEQQYFLNLNTRIRDIEEKQRLQKDRLLLIGKNMISDKEKLFDEIQELKKTTLKLKEENLKLKEFIQRISELISETARKEEIMILQRQLDTLRDSKEDTK